MLHSDRHAVSRMNKIVTQTNVKTGAILNQNPCVDEPFNLTRLAPHAHDVRRRRLRTQTTGTFKR